MKFNILTKRYIKIFLISLSLTFLMTAIPLGFRQTWVKPAFQQVDVLEQMKPLLEARPNHFQIKKEYVPDVSENQSGAEQSSAYAVVDMEGGQVIASKNLSKKLPIASLTKIMTSVVALDLVRPGEQFSVPHNATLQVPTKVMLRAGETYRLENLLKFALISSANDAAEVIKEGIDNKFGQGTFIKAMNLKAKFLGLKNTRFANAKGYDNNENFSSAEDLSILSAYALTEYPEIAGIVSREYEDLTGGIDYRFYLNNWNGLLGVYPGVSGIKIGNTRNAGHTTVVASEREGRKILAVVLGAPGIMERDLWAARLLDLGFTKTAGLKPVNITRNQLQAKYDSWQYF